MQFPRFIAILAIAISAVSADRSVVLLLNYGIASNTSGSCNASELALTEAIVQASSLNSTYARRQLRNSADMDDMTEDMKMAISTNHPEDDEDAHRNLIVYSAACKNLCAGQTPGYCTAVSCKGYRRRHLLSDEPDDRALLSGASFTCTQQTTYIHTELDKLVNGNKVSASCKTLLTKPRGLTCFDDVIYGVVEQFKVWDTTTRPQTLLYSNFTGGNICIHKTITIETIPNDCVDSVLTTLTGPNGYIYQRHEWDIPYSVFGDTGAGNLLGRTLPYVGNYTLTALPDGLLFKQKVITFNAVELSVTAVRLWDPVSKTVTNPNFTGGNLCNNKKVGFEFVISCGQSVQAFLKSTSNGYSHNRTEIHAPYSLFGDGGGNCIYGELLSNGLYTLTIYPDQMVEKVKTIQFNVVTC